MQQLIYFRQFQSDYDENDIQKVRIWKIETITQTITATQNKDTNYFHRIYLYFFICKSFRFSKNIKTIIASKLIFKKSDSTDWASFSP